MLCRRWLPLAALALALSPSPLSAQIKPKIMIIFDTSGSMDANSANVTQDGDGTPLCSGKGTSTRIHQLKSALFEVLQGMGNAEIDFALATYPQKVAPNFVPECFTPAPSTSCMYQGQFCSGHYYTAIAQGSELFGYVSPYYSCKISSHLFCSSDADCGPGGKCCLDPTKCKGASVPPMNPPMNVCFVANPSQTTADCSAPGSCPWYPDYKTEVLRVPFGAPIENILWYFDGVEDAGAVPALQNPEIRAHPVFSTPLGKSLFYAHGYFDKEVALPVGDYRKKCEKLVVALFTDGLERCNVDPTDVFYPQTWAKNLAGNPKFKPIPAATTGVTSYTVGIDISDPLGQANLTSIATAGHGKYYNVTGSSSSLKTAFLDIVANSQPPVETCNGEDDDCDGQVDEDFPQKGQPCNNGLFGVCFKAGTYVCNSQKTGVVCDAPAATGSAETCNGLDDNCNGQVDEGLTCTPCTSQPEICNNKDDDCDSKTDEDIPANPCGKKVGVCTTGVTKCVAGKLICEGATMGSKEICDNLDNDCDGVVDGFSEPCYTAATGCDLVAGKCLGICKIGAKTCTAGVFDKCEGEIVPKLEECNGLDDDCNGKIDDGAICPGGAQCIEGSCAQKCGSSEFNCPKGQLCKGGWCTVDPCDPELCDKDHPGWICKAGTCVDPCVVVTCDPGYLCKRGLCEDQSCYKQGCPAGERCVGGVCQKDSCVGVSCKDDEFCSGGRCHPVCDTVVCSAGESCKVVESDGTLVPKCVQDPCASVSCRPGQVCAAGQCVLDSCMGLTCEIGKICEAGQCIPDLCDKVRCSPRYPVCKNGICSSPLSEGGVDILATGGGGSSCSLGPLGDGPAPGLPTFILMLGGLVLALGRRSRRS